MLGRGAIVPIVNMATTCTALILVLSLVVLLTLRRRQPESPGFAVPGGTTTVLVSLAGALLMAGFALSQPLFLNPNRIPLEWMLMAAWAALGLLFSRFPRRPGGVQIVQCNKNTSS